MSSGESKGKGNIQNLTASLMSSNINDKKTAMKTIISAMTCGEDVSMFFTAVETTHPDHSEHGEPEPRPEETELPLRDQLCKDPPGYRYSGDQLLQKGRITSAGRARG